MRVFIRPIFSRRRVLIAAAAATVLVVVGWFIGLPVLAHYAARRALAAAGLEPANFRITSAGFSSMRMADLSIGEPRWFSAGAATVTYSLADLLARRIRSIEIAEAQWTVQVRGSDIDWGPPSRPLRSSAVVDLPFDRVEVHDSSVRLMIDSVEYKIPASGQVNRSAMAGQSAEWEFEIATSGLDWRGASFVALSAGPVALEVAPAGVRVTGRVDQRSLTIVVSPGVVGSLIALTSEAIACRAPSIQQALDLTLQEPGATVIIPFEAGTSCSVQVPELDLKLGDAAIRTAWGGAEHVSFWLPLSLTTDGDAVRIEAMQAATVSMREVTIGPDSGPATVPELSVLLSQQQAKPLFTIGRRDGSPTAEISAGIQSVSPVSIMLASAFANGVLESITANLTAVIAAGGPQLVQGDLIVDGGAVTGGGLAISAVRLKAAWDERGRVVVTALDGTVGLDGAISAEPFQIDRIRRRAQARLSLHHLNLEEWLPLLTGGRAAGEGHLSGGLEIALNWADDVGRSRPRIEIIAAELRAAPEHGFIQVIDTDALGEMLESQDPRFAQGGAQRDIRDRILAAMRDFAFSTLTLDVARTHGRARAIVHTSGRGRVGADSQELNLTVNVPDFDRVLQLAIMLNSELGGATDRALNQFFLGGNQGEEQRP